MSGKFVYLPEMDPGIEVAPAEAAAWSSLSGGAGSLRRLADALVVKGVEIDSTNIKSVPSPWARPLLFEHALFADHPARPQVRSEWRGLLAVIAYSRLLPYQLSATGVDIAKDARDVRRDLATLLPTGAGELWQRFGLLSVDGHVVGATSPLTLVYTGYRSIPVQRIPFQKQGRLIDPVDFYKGTDNAPLLDTLLAWVSDLEGTIESLSDTAFSDVAADDDSKARAGKLAAALGDWKTDIAKAGGNAGSSHEFDQSPFHNVFSGQAATIFCSLRPVKMVEVPPPPRSDLLLHGSTDHAVDGGGATILVGGVPFNGAFTISPGIPAVVKDGVIVGHADPSQQGVTVIRNLAQAFEPALVPLADVNDETVITLAIGTRRFLLPIRLDALADGLLPSQVARWVSGTGDNMSGYTVNFDVPIQSGRVARFTRRYSSADVRSEANTPSLAVWPDFEAADWKHYYYVVEHKATSDRLELSHAGVQPARNTAGNLQWGFSRRPLSVFTGSSGTARGWLLVRNEAHDALTGVSWDVSIDFGSTHTRVFAREAADVPPRELEIAPRARVCLGGAGLLPFHFFPAFGEDIGDLKELRTLLRLPGGELTPEGEGWLPRNGVIDWKPFWEPTASAKGLKSHLKWHEREEDVPAFRSYISQLFVSALAEARARGARIGSLITAFPSAFPFHLREAHKRGWDRLKTEFGVDLLEAVPEALAVASHLTKSHRGAPTVALLAVDVGGSTTDLAVWAESKPKAHDSVRFAGGLVSRLIGLDAELRSHASSCLAALIGPSPLTWRDDPILDGLVFNSVLRHVSRLHGGHSTPVAKAIYRGPDSAGARIIAHAGYLFATVSYLLGLMVGRAKVAQPEYAIYFAGRGSEFLRWLDVLAPNGKTDIPRTFFLSGLQIAEGSGHVRVELPEADIKKEVGLGLLEDPIAAVDDAPRERVTFWGETLHDGSGANHPWSDTLDVSCLRGLAVPKTLSGEPLPILSRFLETFQEFDAGRFLLRGLGVDRFKLTEEVRGRIAQAVYGTGSAWHAAVREGREAGEDSLLEPVFIAGARSVLEVHSHPRLFG